MSYNRSGYKHFLPHKHGGTVRDFVLAMESQVKPTRDEDGKVVSGLWVCPYTGFITSNPSKLDIDHFMALSEIHRVGGDKLSQDEKMAIANDPDNLVAVKAGSNRSKSDRNSWDWMIPNVANIEWYISKREFVRAKYNLSDEPGAADARKFFLMVAKRHNNGIKVGRVRSWFGKKFNWVYSPL